MNRIAATITAIERAGSLCLVECDAAGQKLISLVIDEGDQYQPGQACTLLFKEASVGLVLPGATSTYENQWPGTVKDQQTGSLLNMVSVDCNQFQVVSLLSKWQPGVKPGMAVQCLVKASDIMISRGDV